MSDRVVEFRVGVMVLATAIIAGILVVLFGDLPSLVQATYPLKMSFEDARGIATGTPVGVGIGFKPPRFLARGDTISMEVEGIGRLTNPVR